MKRVVKMKVAYLESIIEDLRCYNGCTEAQVRAMVGWSKTAALENVIRGLESTVNRTKENKKVEAATNACYDRCANGGV